MTIKYSIQQKGDKWNVVELKPNPGFFLVKDVVASFDWRDQAADVATALQSNYERHEVGKEIGS